MIGFLAALISGVGELISFKKQTYLKEKERDIAKIENETALLKDPNNNNRAWEMSQLCNGDRLLKWGAFLLFASPFFSYMISPELGARVSQAWQRLPEWQSAVLSGICFAIFGMKQIPNMVGGIIGNVVKAIKQ